MIFYFDGKGAKLVIEQARATNRSIMLVKEIGVFIKPESFHNDPISTHICKAYGCDEGILSRCIHNLENHLGTGGSDEIFYLDANESFFDLVLKEDGILGLEFSFENPEIGINGYFYKKPINNPIKNT